ncbi:hypothetical protein LCGC14_1520600 [marine sediment metagenome]|uniref:Uncharacterized protein n=1 Tax=marine sediment metagenome TaxID=412755 RepID=A0A0F9LED1_9ZZZZ
MAEEPGSRKGVPETGDIRFQWQYDRNAPGQRHKIAFLDTPSGDLVIFPHRDWDAPVGVTIECIIYPANRSGIAAPKGGIPASQKVSSYTLETLPVDIRRALVDEINTTLNRMTDAFEASTNLFNGLIERLSHDTSWGEEESDALAEAPSGGE